MITVTHLLNNTCSNNVYIEKLLLYFYFWAVIIKVNCMAKIKLVPGQLYFLREQDYLTSEISDYVKIGLVKNERETVERMKDHQTGNPRNIIEYESLHEVPMVGELESQLHRLYAELRVSGEWFKMTDAEVETAISKARSIIEEQRTIYSQLKESYELDQSESNGRTIESNGDHQHAWRDFVDCRYDLDVVKTQQKIVERKLRAAMGTFAGIEGIVDFTEKKSADSFDKKKFMEEHADVAAEYITEDEKPSSGRFLLKNARKLQDENPDLKQELKVNPENKPDFSEVQLSTKLPSSSDLMALHANYLEFEHSIVELSWAHDRAEAKLKCMLNVNESIEGLCAWKREPKMTEKFDAARLKEDQPDLYAQYIIPGKSGYAVSVRPYRAYSF